MAKRLKKAVRDHLKVYEAADCLWKASNMKLHTPGYRCSWVSNAGAGLCWS